MTVANCFPRKEDPVSGRAGMAIRSLAGRPRDEICQVLAAAARRAFDLLRPSLGGCGAGA